ncbi:MAG: hypothetical protein Q9174_004751 [Haloplaca sp. 1 TL-2023]
MLVGAYVPLARVVGEDVDADEADDDTANDMVDKFVNGDGDMTEKSIKNTHAILVGGFNDAANDDMAVEKRSKASLARNPLAAAYWRNASVPATSSVNGAVNFLQDAFDLPPVCDPYDKHDTRNHVMGPEKPSDDLRDEVEGTVS